MATKAEITTHINTDLASGTLIPASNHRGVLHTDADSLLENFYGLKTTDTNASTNVFTIDAGVSADIIYSVITTKQGGVVNVRGSFRNISGSFISQGTTLFLITNSEYLQQSGTSVTDVGFSNFTNEIVQVNMNSSSFVVLNEVGIDEVILFDLTYNTEA